jgi:hypothetical protein
LYSYSFDCPAARHVHFKPAAAWYFPFLCG